MSTYTVEKIAPDRIKVCFKVATKEGLAASKLLECISKQLCLHTSKLSGYVMTTGQNVEKFELLYKAGFRVVGSRNAFCLVHAPSGVKFQYSYALQLAEQPDRLAVETFLASADNQQ
jgi:hypothetical protein